MKIVLKDFQDEYVSELVDEFRAATRESVRKGQALGLSAPTGSGKTVMATAFIEHVLAGDDEPGDPDVVFLWVTDQPELNEQTRDKMRATSSVLDPTRLVVLDAGFDAERFAAGHVYFLNTQKLGRKSSLAQVGEGRTFTIWQTISNTVEADHSRFVLIIDEAHRGMQEANARNEANTIIQKFIKGSEGEIPPIPLVLGVSATIERFHQLIAGSTRRTARYVDVPAEEVRESGLIKEAIELYHPQEAQPSDITMLRTAAESWKQYRDQWAAFATSQGETFKEPVFLVQVQDGSAGKLSNTDLAEVVRVLDQEFPGVPNEWYAHAFQEKASITVGGREIRYLAPSRIDADHDVRVVLFKTSLNTGWDCPRAEVMASFRVAKDDTLIAQLVGRMVRAPLARRIDDNEFLNTVSLFLPNYDKESLGKVIRKLQEDPGLLPPADVRDATDTVQLDRAPGTEEIFEILARAPSYTIPRKRRISPVVRLGKLASLLSETGKDTEAPKTATAQLVDALESEYQARKSNDAFTAIATDLGVLDVRKVTYAHDSVRLTETTTQVKISPENVEDLFKDAGRLLGEGLHIQFWRARAAVGATDHRKTKLETYALASDPEVLAKVEQTATKLTKEWIDNYKASVSKLDEKYAQRFREIQELASDPEQTSLTFPSRLEWQKAERAWERHIYVDVAGSFHEDFAKSGWEPKVVTQTLADPQVVGWLRSVDRKPWALCVPYKKGGVWAGAYPDFLMFRRTVGGIVVDIVDPHLLSDQEAPFRAAGMADFAAKHHDFFGRIELIIVDGNKIKRLDLIDPVVRRKVSEVTTHAHLRQLFDSVS